MWGSTLKTENEIEVNLKHPSPSDKLVTLKHRDRRTVTKTGQRSLAHNSNGQ